MMNWNGELSFWNRFVVNQLFDGSDPNLKRNLTVYPENTSKRFNSRFNGLKFDFCLDQKDEKEGLEDLAIEFLIEISFS